MKVVLTQSVAKVGNKGDIIEVSEGYARNFLFPQKKAIAATEKNINKVKSESKSAAKQKTDSKIVQTLKKIGGKSFEISMNADDNETLFASMTAKKLSDYLQSQGYGIPEGVIVLDDPIKKLGTYKIPLLHNSVKATITITITTSA